MYCIFFNYETIGIVLYSQKFSHNSAKMYISAKIASLFKMKFKWSLYLKAGTSNQVLQIKYF